MKSLGCRMRQHIWKSVAAWGCVLVLAPAPIWAQDEAGIAGAVTDETAGALPGVTVVAASPALIEQNRTAVTNGSGTYRFIALPPGTYSVTFTLPGFKTVVRSGVMLKGAFVANVDASLAIGELTETVRVSGAAPLVDVKNTQLQSVLTAERVNVLPGAASIYTAAQYVPGTIMGGPRDSPMECFGGGTEGCGNLPIVHGSDPLDGQPAIDGVKTGMQLQGRNEWRAGVGLVTNEAMVSEVVVDTSSQNAEFAQSGVRTNIIPKAGGNNFTFDIFARGTNDNFASNNLSPELEEQGFQFAPTAYSWNINPAVGGPIKENTLWFFGSIYEGRRQSFILDTFFDLDEPSTPDSVTADDLRAFNNTTERQQTLRIHASAHPAQQADLQRDESGERWGPVF